VEGKFEEEKHIGKDKKEKNNVDSEWSETIAPL